MEDKTLTEAFQEAFALLVKMVHEIEEEGRVHDKLYRQADRFVSEICTQGSLVEILD